MAPVRGSCAFCAMGRVCFHLLLQSSQEDLATHGTRKVYKYEDVLVECLGCEYRARFCRAGIAYASHLTLEVAEEAEDCFGGRLPVRLLVSDILSLLGGRKTDVSTVHARYRLSDLCWCTTHTLNTTLQHLRQKQ